MCVCVCVGIGSGRGQESRNYGLGVRSACLIALEISPCHERNASGSHDQRMILRGNMVGWRNMGL